MNWATKRLGRHISTQNLIAIEQICMVGQTHMYLQKQWERCLWLHHKDNIPLIIIHPTIVTGTNKDPFPGWIEGVRTLDAVIRDYGLGKIDRFVSDPKTTLDMVPADFVINCMIITIFVHPNQAPTNFIYHVSSSLRNPVKLSDIQNIIYQYFMKPLA